MTERREFPPKLPGFGDDKDTTAKMAADLQASRNKAKLFDQAKNIISEETPHVHMKKGERRDING